MQAARWPWNHSDRQRWVAGSAFTGEVSPGAGGDLRGLLNLKRCRRDFAGEATGLSARAEPFAGCEGRISEMGRSWPCAEGLSLFRRLGSCEKSPVLALQRPGKEKQAYSPFHLIVHSFTHSVRTSPVPTWSRGWRVQAGGDGKVKRLQFGVESAL